MNFFFESANIHHRIFFVETHRSYELNDDYSKFKSYSLDPFPDCQLKKRTSGIATRNNEHVQSIHDDDDDHDESTRIATTKALMLDCNGDINAASQSQRSDHIPLLTNTNRKRWHSLEMVRCATADNAIGGCEDYNIDDRNSKKSLGRNILKSWLVGLFNPSSHGLRGSSAATSARNGSGILLPQSQQVHPVQQPLPTVTASKPDKETSIV